MARSRAPQARRQQPPEPSPRYLPPYRVVIFLPFLAFLVALTAQIILKAAGGLESDHPLRVFLTPAVAAAVVFFGLSRYPRGSRLRLAAMVAAGLFLFALLT